MYIECDEHDLECRMDIADHQLDQAIDDFILAETEEQASDAISRYPTLLRYLPNKWQYVLQLNKLNSIRAALHNDDTYHLHLLDEVAEYIRNNNKG